MAVIHSVHEPNMVYGSQPSPPTYVPIIHQIFGVFRDGKPMSRLFANSLHRWRQVAQRMSAQHHLWSVDEVEALIKQQYPLLWHTYVHVPFSVMRVDIGRVAILHHYGGMYADLDVYPNRDTYAHADFAVQKVYASGYCSSKTKCVPAKRKHNVAHKSDVIDMEVLIAAQGHPILLDWLDYMRQQIEEKNYAESQFYQTAKIRYIHQTTGPQCLARFLRLQENQQVRRKMKFVSCNNFACVDELTIPELQLFDVLSFESNSYYGEKNAFKSLVGDGDGAVPVLHGSQPSVRLLRRFNTKRKVTEDDVVNKPSDISSSSDVVQYPSGDAVEASRCSDSDTSSLPDVDECAAISMRAMQSIQTPIGRKFRMRAKTRLHSPAECTDITPRITEHGEQTPAKSFSDQVVQTSAKAFSDQDVQTSQTTVCVRHADHGTQTPTRRDDCITVNDLRRHIKTWGNCIATKTFLEDLPGHVFRFVTEPVHREQVPSPSTQ